MVFMGTTPPKYDCEIFHEIVAGINDTEGPEADGSLDHGDRFLVLVRFASIIVLRVYRKGLSYSSMLRVWSMFTLGFQFTGRLYNKFMRLEGLAR